MSELSPFAAAALAKIADLAGLAGLGLLPGQREALAGAARHEELCVTFAAIYHPLTHRQISVWSIHMGSTTAHSTNDWLATIWAVMHEGDPYRRARALERLRAMVEPDRDMAIRLVAQLAVRGDISDRVGRWFVAEVSAFTPPVAPG